MNHNFNFLINEFKEEEDCAELGAYFAKQTGESINLSEAWNVFKEHHYDQLEKKNRMDMVFAWACVLNQADEVAAILKKQVKGLDVNCRIGHVKWTPLHIVALYGHLELANAFLKQQANVNQGSTDGSTPLFIAAFHGHLDVVKTLLQSQANVDQARTTDGVSPLFAAVNKGHLDIVKTLLKQQANVNQVMATNGATPLLAAVEEEHHEIIVLLLNKGGKIDAQIAKHWRKPLIQGLKINTTQTTLGDASIVAFFTKEEQCEINVIFERNEKIISYHQKIISLIEIITNGLDETAQDTGRIKEIACLVDEYNGHIKEIARLVEHIRELSVDAIQLEDIQIKIIDMYIARGEPEQALEQLENLPIEMLDNGKREEKLWLIALHMMGKMTTEKNAYTEQIMKLIPSIPGDSRDAQVVLFRCAVFFVMGKDKDGLIPNINDFLESVTARTKFFQLKEHHPAACSLLVRAIIESAQDTDKIKQFRNVFELPEEQAIPSEKTPKPSVPHIATPFFYVKSSNEQKQPELVLNAKMIT